MSNINVKMHILDAHRIEPIQVVYGNNSVGISVELKDITIPAGASAVVYASDEKSEHTRIQRTVTITGNTLSFVPDIGFFNPGDNRCQFDVTASGKHIVTFQLKVRCAGHLADGDTPVTVEEVLPYVERAESAATTAETAKTAAQTAATNAQTAKTGAETAKTAAETAASNLVRDIQNNYPTYAQVATELATQKQDIADIEDAVFYEEKTEYAGTYAVTQGTTVQAGKYVLPVTLSAGDSYTIKFSCENNEVTRPTYYEVETDGTKHSKSAISVGTSVDATAGWNLKGITFYVTGTGVLATGNITLTITHSEYNEESLEKRVSDAEDDIDALETNVSKTLPLIEKTETINNWLYVNANRVAIKYGSGLKSITLNQATANAIWFAVQGYENPNFTTRVYDSGWLKNTSNTVTPTNQALYYYIICQKYPTAETTVDFAKQNTTVVATGVVDIIGDIADIRNLAISNGLKPSLTYKSIAHRGRYGTGIGAMCCASAVIAAKKQGYDACENDVALTSDGKMVMWHDTDLSKIGQTGSVSDYTLSQLKDLDFGSSFGLPSEQILTFEEWIKLCKSLGMECYIDFKVVGDSFTDALAQELVQTVRRAGMLDHVAYLNNHAKIRTYHPHARLLILNNPTESTIQLWTPVLSDCEVIWNPSASAVTQDAINLALDNGFGYECWYVDYGTLTEEEIFAKICDLIDMGVQAMTLDKYRIDDAVLKEHGIL